MKANPVGVLLMLSLLLAQEVVSQSSFWFQNFNPDAPVFDAQGVPLAGSGYLAELWGGPTSDSLAPLVLFTPGFPRLIKPFTSNGYVVSADGGNLVVTTLPPFGWAWLEMRAWDASLGATYEGVVALGLGGYGESPLFYARGGDPNSPNGSLQGFLIGLESFSLRPIIPEPSSGALLALGGVALWLTRPKRPE